MFVEDLSAFFTDYATVATWQSVSVNVIFDHAYVDALGIAGENPVAHAQVADMPGVKSGQAIIINGTSYIISNPPQPDGTGLLRLELRKA